MLTRLPAIHTTTLADMAARSSAVTFSYWIGYVVLLAPCIVGHVDNSMQVFSLFCNWRASSLLLIPADCFHGMPGSPC